MLIAHRIALDPTNKQRTYFARAAGTARFAYNWALAEWKAQYGAGKSDPSLPAPSEASLRKKLNSLKRENFPWMFDVTKCAVQEAVIDLGSAFAAFFEKRAKYPKFKKKGAHDSFCAANEVGTFRCDGKRIKLPKIGWVRMRETVRFDGVLKRVTVTRTADRWFASILVDAPGPEPVVDRNGTVGIDVGVKVLITPSKGEPVHGPKAHTVLLKRLRRVSRAMSRKRHHSRNRARAQRKLARLHARIANIRRDAAHKATTMLAKTYRRIGIEDLNVRGMVRNRHLARSVTDGAFFEIRRQLEYKERMYATTVVVADRWFPSSKTCSCCGVVKGTLDSNDRTFRCDDCGFECDRDLNAARNLENYADSFAALKAVSTAVACGGERSGARRRSRVKRSSVKQEPDIKAA
jgi:putative transposase